MQLLASTFHIRAKIAQTFQPARTVSHLIPSFWLRLQIFHRDYWACNGLRRKVKCRVMYVLLNLLKQVCMGMYGGGSSKGSFCLQPPQVFKKQKYPVKFVIYVFLKLDYLNISHWHSPQVRTLSFTTVFFGFGWGF